MDDILRTAAVFTVVFCSHGTTTDGASQIESVHQEYKEDDGLMAVGGLIISKKHGCLGIPYQVQYGYDRA
jgi:hypothetical protein